MSFSCIIYHVGNVIVVTSTGWFFRSSHVYLRMLLLRRAQVYTRYETIYTHKKTMDVFMFIFFLIKKFIGKLVRVNAIVKTLFSYNGQSCPVLLVIARLATKTYRSGTLSTHVHGLLGINCTDALEFLYFSGLVHHHHKMDVEQNPSCFSSTLTPRICAAPTATLGSTPMFRVQTLLGQT